MVVATNARLNKVQATKLAQLGSLGMARTIYPVNTMFDGDITFALSIGDKTADINALGWPRPKRWPGHPARRKAGEDAGRRAGAGVTA